MVDTNLQREGEHYGDRGWGTRVSMGLGAEVKKRKVGEEQEEDAALE